MRCIASKVFDLSYASRDDSPSCDAVTRADLLTGNKRTPGGNYDTAAAGQSKRERERRIAYPWS